MVRWHVAHIERTPCVVPIFLVLLLVFTGPSTPQCETKRIPTPRPRSAALLAATPLPTIVIGIPSLPEGAKHLDLAWVPAGTSTMGSADGESDEAPPHEVAISEPFYIGVYEVTLAQWLTAMDTNPYLGSGLDQCSDYPIYSISWNDANTFIRRLSNICRGAFRMPTEAEWEYVCRAETTTRFYWGDDADGSQIAQYAWYAGNSGGIPHEVGLKQPNDWGIHDMSGNVWEWCSDRYGPYPSEPQVDPTGATSGLFRVARGGARQDPASDCRSAHRRYEMSVVRTNIGLRLVWFDDGSARATPTPIPTATPVPTPSATPTPYIYEYPTPTPTPYGYKYPTATPIYSPEHTPAPEGTSTPTTTPTSEHPEHEEEKESGTVTKGDNKTTLDDAEPINMATGEYYFTLRLLSLGGIIPLEYHLYYGSQVDSKRWPDGLSYRFIGNHRISITRYEFGPPLGSQLFVETGLGEEIGFSKTNTEWTVFNRENARHQLQETEQYYYFLDLTTGLVYIFKKQSDDGFASTAFLIYVIDRNGNRLTYENPDGDEILNRGPDRVYDGLGRELRFTYQDIAYEDQWGEQLTEPFLTRITDQNGRAVTLTYEANPQDNPDNIVLRSITDPMGNTTTFTYAGMERMTGMTMPLGNTPYTQTYNDSYPRRGVVATQTDANGNTTTIAPGQYTPYVQEQSQFSITYPDGSQRTFQHDHRSTVMKSVTDAEGNSIQFDSDPKKQRVTGVTDRLGRRLSTTYHEESGLISGLTNAKGETVTHTYTAQSQAFTNPDANEQATFTFYNLTGITYPDGSTEQYTYDASGNITSWVDANGNTWRHTYNGQGQMLTETFPTGGIVTYTYNEDGTLASRQDAETDPTTYNYDQYKRLTGIRNPEGRTLAFVYDLNDRFTSMTDERRNTHTYTYDANGNLLKEIDPAGNETTYTYDQMDRVVRVTDKVGKSGKSVSVTYDSRDRIAEVTDADGSKIEYGYDSLGNLIEVKRGGQIWRTSFDSEGLMISTTSPLGNVTTYQRDEVGRVVGITAPLGNATNFAHDFFGRQTSVTDPLGRTTNYEYDSRGKLISITAPGIGTARYERNPLGLLTQITDLNGQTRDFTYTPGGYLQTMTDPSGNRWAYGYDNQGRRNRIIFPDGSEQTTAYDGVGNVSSERWSDGTILNFQYDSLNQMIGARNVNLTLDPEGRVTNSIGTGPSYGATYDDAGRLQTATYNDGAFQVVYTYDLETGVLSRVSDNLTNSTVDFIYDNDEQLIGINRSNGVNTEYTLDAASNVIRVQEGLIVSSQHTYDSFGAVSQSVIESPLDPSAMLTPGSEDWTYDSASQVSSAGYLYDALGRATAAPGYTFGWQADTHLTEINDVALAYNGLGNVISRTEDGGTIHYDYNYALDLAPIVAERGGSGPLRYYVWTPDGSLLYMIDAANNNQVYFYHFDQIGSTLALTDQTGNVTDAYAYDPYGRLLAHQGSNPQPFTFVGQWGVRQEGSEGDLYQMRARYYDSRSGRFLSRDEAWPELEQPLALNPYVYAALNPVNLVDPTGMFLDSLLPGTSGRSLNRAFYKFVKTLESYFVIPSLYTSSVVSGGGLVGWLSKKIGLTQKVQTGLFRVFMGSRPKPLGVPRAGLSRGLQTIKIPKTPGKVIGWGGKLFKGLTLVEGAISWYKIGTWARANEQDRKRMMREELSAKVTTYVIERGEEFVTKGRTKLWETGSGTRVYLDTRGLKEAARDIRGWLGL